MNLGRATLRPQLSDLGITCKRGRCLRRFCSAMQPGNGKRNNHSPYEAYSITSTTRTSVKQHVGQLDYLGSNRFRELNHLRQAIDVAPVDHKIEAERNSFCANFCSNIQLALMRARPRDFVRQTGLIGLET